MYDAVNDYISIAYHGYGLFVYLLQKLNIFGGVLAFRIFDNPLKPVPKIKAVRQNRPQPLIYVQKPPNRCFSRMF